MTQEHTLKAFDADIAILRKSVITMGAMVERQLVRAIDAVRTHDLAMVTQVLTDEEAVNGLHMQTDLRCNQTIARRQPIAVDLREIIAVLHINNDLERVGDEAKKIALRSRDLRGSRSSMPDLVAGVEKMTALVVEMLGQAVGAFSAQDASVAEMLKKRDHDVDALRDELIGKLIDRMGTDSEAVTAALSMIFIVQSIERIGDHAKSIAELMIHVVEGVDRRHMPEEPT